MPPRTFFAALLLALVSHPAAAEPIATKEKACEPARTKQDIDQLDPIWSEALQRLIEATTEADKPWGCPGATLVLQVTGEGATLVVERETAAKVRALEAEVVDLAMDRAETLLKEKFGAADQQSAITAYVGEVSNAALGGSVR